MLSKTAVKPLPDVLWSVTEHQGAVHGRLGSQALLRGGSV